MDMDCRPTFTHVVVTSPTPQTALAYEIQMQELRTALPCLAHTDVLSVADPVGDRIGSGGGTINAVKHFTEKYGVDGLRTARILVVHSGGDSRRIPIHSVCGKAWSCLNYEPFTTIRPSTGGALDTSPPLMDSILLSSPMALLIAELSEFCKNVVDGCLVVTSSDVLLDLGCLAGGGGGGGSVGGAPVFDADSVSLVGIPEVLETAKNHGILLPRDGFPSDSDDGMIERPMFVSTVCKGYMQKPSLMDISQSGASFSGSGRFAAESFAWIDSGIVVFSGSAFQTLGSLLDHPLIAAMCDNRGGGRACLAGESGSRLRLELYSDILLACSLNEVPRDKSEYLKSLGHSSGAVGAPMDEALSILLERFNSVPLKCVLVENGIFCHLGTVSELLELVMSCTAPSPETITYAAHKYKALCAKYGLRASTCSVIDSDSSHTSLLSGCLINSIIDGSGLIAARTIVEHSMLLGSYNIGRGSIVSHVDATFGRDLTLGDEQVLQFVSLLGASSDADMKIPSILMYFGVGDDVKGSLASGKATLLGRKWNDVFQMYGISSEDIWPDYLSAHPDSLCLWNAKIFPVIEKEFGADNSQQTYFVIRDDNGNELTRDGLSIRRVCMVFGETCSCDHGAAHSSEAIVLWKRSHRISMSEMLKRGDSFEMMNWRKYLHSWLVCGDPSSVVRSLTASVRADTFMRNWNRIHVALLRFLSSLRSCLQSPQGTETFNLSHIELLSLVYQIVFSLWCVFLPIQNMPDALRAVSIKLVDSLLKTLFPGFSFDTEKVCLLCDILNDFWYSIPISSKYYSIMFLKSSVGKLHKSILDVVLRDGFLNALPHLPSSSHPRVPLILSYMCQCDFISAATSESCTKRMDSFSNEDLSLSAVQQCSAEVLAMVIEDILQKQNQRFDNCLSLEDVSQRIVSFQVRYSLREHKTSLDAPGCSDREASPVDIYESFAANETVLVTAPVRIDVIGGWSDTPPICYESGGAVVNVAVAVDGVRPMRCAARFIGSPVVVLRSVPYKMIASLRLNSSPDLIANHEEEIHDCDVVEITLDELSTMRGLVNPTSKCALLKACIVLLIDDVMSALSQGGGIEIACCSALPAGSGMGGSSVLASVAIQALASLLQRNCSAEDLVYLVSQVEQILTTGGGWQDQIGGVFGGFKIGFSNQGLPMRVRVHAIEASDDEALRLAIARAFEDRVHLIFTGKQRLAKNTLINALYKCALTPVLHYDTFDAMRAIRSNTYESRDESHHDGGTVFHLIHEAIKCASAMENLLKSRSERVEDEDLMDLAHTFIDQFAYSISTYWALKRDMAAGSEPEYIHHLRLHLAGVCAGFSLCGAGGGGYAVAVLKRETEVHALQSKITEYNSNYVDSTVAPICTMHKSSIDFEGIRVATKVCDRTSSILEAML